MDNTFKSPSTISYCTGLRGLERGVERAIGTIRTAVYVEIEAFIIENLLAGMEAGILAPAPIWANIKTFDARPFRDKIHGIIGGYPCQPFSNAGKRKGETDPRHIYPYLERDIETIRPVWVFFENVSGHLSLGFDQVYRSLSKMGYAVEAGIFTAEEVGAPHERERLFILAICKEYLANSNSNFGRGEQHNKIFGCVPESYKNDSAMANPTEQRLQTRRESQPGKQSTIKRSGQYEDIWPARPGQSQYTWEEPRTIKPSMGSTINGYNFREDLLRAYGNSVVEQTAELAFITLLEKHGIFVL